MKTTSKKEEVKKEGLKGCITLWIQKGKNGKEYLSGTAYDGTKVVGFYNSNKENPKEPDIRVYVDTEGKKTETLVSLWENISKNEKR